MDIDSRIPLFTYVAQPLRQASRKRTIRLGFTCLAFPSVNKQKDTISKNDRQTANRDAATSTRWANSAVSRGGVFAAYVLLTAKH